MLFLQTEKLLLTFIALFQLTETGTASEQKSVRVAFKNKLCLVLLIY